MLCGSSTSHASLSLPACELAVEVKEDSIVCSGTSSVLFILSGIALKIKSSSSSVNFPSHLLNHIVLYPDVS